jgi:FkbM family methyltransferase
MSNPPDKDTNPLVRIRQCRHGLMAYFPHDIFIGGALERYGEYVERELDLLLSHVVEGSVVVEVGANIGCDTVALARKVGSTGRVFAFEPQRIIYQMLCANLAINGIWNVLAERAALGSAPGLLRVPPVDYSKPGNFGGVALQDQGAEPVQVLTLDAYQLERCDLIKIDVEGMELEVLKGAAGTISRTRPAIYCENDREEKSPALIGFLRALDYALYWHFPAMFNADNFCKNPVNVFQRSGKDIVSMNMLCLPREKGISSPLQPVRL